ncbi:uncharacterized protein DUF4625 [Arcticibacter tournemirensis]|uniref:DUF4625 domain-containing protein n=1 Tax=Arcticibacter tournemirensis TaxID=699437 RepID=A0A4Q0M9W1_9SPHI|nr:DUF4625 domain-containing protein [Arcticibacter tournemirensis]KAA8485311.1 DUF4625 domain-containing protein [Arcticibacter tournemirensis]RXF70008.1 DUF4625 domain-containing protein [Arcticibacter tournemirensis]TQM50404.1 uncharacterized protein DUF4625 [Arcticibacter tournemirensis]
MKISLKSSIILFISLIFISSCKKDEDETTPAPSLNNLEIGTGNNKTAYPGSDIHIEAEILAPAIIASVKLEIHPQSGEGWSYEQEYTEGFSGLKNAEFHKHIDIPAEAPLGHYHVHLSVTDALGQSTEVESDLEIKFDPSLPSATGLEVSPNTAGTDLHLEAVISAINKIAKVVVEVHGAEWEKEFEFTDAAMIGQTTYNFHKHVNITEAPAGHYHVHLKIVDQQGKENEFEEHFDKK